MTQFDVYFCISAAAVEPVTCEDPLIPANANRDVGGMQEGETVVYRCNDGYEFIGISDTELTLVCGSDATWSGTVPGCNSKNMPQQKKHICIPFVQCWTSIEDFGPTLYKCYTHVLCFLGYII